ncbi:VOC family protein [Cyanobacterium sp. IPPAS B-1200]|uniref:VOC family protein n=1 Tax=Cyanobacterium sp. IPPAS B-1200 TaxID=1562720 RepID=UPI00085275DC|nr:VOC family protein [Cyanobacterium sp. IPPAS B-1200]OEJ78475.1 glyoxalase [Cyanobacterium sp. IPPAS B-1200]
MLHHVSIRTANILRAIAFYQLLGFSVKERFTTGYTLACWMEGLNSRIELIEIPEPKPALDAFGDEHYVGYYHLSFDVGNYTDSLPQWLNNLTETFVEENKANPQQIKPLKILLHPQQQMIEDKVFEVAFIADDDGLPIELLRKCR